MQLIRKDDAASSSKYIFTREAAVKRLVEVNDDSYGWFKFIKGVSLGAVEGPGSRSPTSLLLRLNPFRRVPWRYRNRQRRQTYAEHRKLSRLRMLLRLQICTRQALLTHLEVVKAQEETHRLRAERQRQRVQLELQKRMAMVES